MCEGLWHKRHSASSILVALKRALCILPWWGVSVLVVLLGDGVDEPHERVLAPGASVQGFPPKPPEPRAEGGLLAAAFVQEALVLTPLLLYHLRVSAGFRVHKVLLVVHHLGNQPNGSLIRRCSFRSLTTTSRTRFLQSTIACDSGF